MYRIDFNATAKKSAALTVFALFLMICIFSLFIGSSFHLASPPQTYLGIDCAAATTQQRIDFLFSLGYSPAPETEECEAVTIPVEFSDVYERYNELQMESGGDLTLYKGAACERCTYIDSETGMRLNLLIYEGRVIGGDECSPALDGEMNPLRIRV